MDSIFSGCVPVSELFPSKTSSFQYAEVLQLLTTSTVCHYFELYLPAGRGFNVFRCRHTGMAHIMSLSVNYRPSSSSVKTLS
jgi:hypothetical protein